MKVFLDTNVIISAIATRGLSADVLRLVLSEHELLVAEVVLKEVERVLTRKFGLPRREIERTLHFLEGFPIEPKPSRASTIDISDPDDAWILESAIQSGAEVLITGDAALLAVSAEVLPLRILSPRGFWELHRQQVEEPPVAPEQGS